jgi:hypothetical protein
MPTATTYAYDPTGVLPANLVPNEQQILTPNVFAEYYCIVPNFAPFFGDSLSIVFVPADTTQASRPFVLGTDFYPTHEFISASRACAKPIYGSITFFNTSLSGVAIISYQTLGGQWLINQQEIATILADTEHNPRTTAWEEVVYVPNNFPPVDHEWNLVDMVGMSEIVTALGTIETSLRDMTQTGLAAHLADYTNPHRVTASQVGLGNVDNFTTATLQDALAGTATNEFMTPYTTMQVVDTVALEPLQTHMADYTNSHKVTAAQTGAYTSSQTDALLIKKLDSTGVAADSAMFGGKTPAAYAAAVLLGTAANAQALGGVSLATLQASITAAGTSATTFGGFTYSAAKQDILSGTAANSLELAGMDVPTLTAQILGGTAANASVAENAQALSGLSVSDLTTQILAGTAANATQFAGLTQSAWEQTIANQITEATSSILAAPTIAATTGDTVNATWYKFATLMFTSGQSAVPADGDSQWLVSGGDNGTASGLYYVRLSLRGALGSEASIEVINLNGVSADVDFGFNTVQSATGSSVYNVGVWFKAGANHSQVTVVQLAIGQGSTLTTSTIAESAVTVEPTGMTYAGSNTLIAATTAELNSLDTTLTALINTAQTAATNAAAAATVAQNVATAALAKANNLSDLTDVVAARTNLGVYSTTQVDTSISTVTTLANQAKSWAQNALASANTANNAIATPVVTVDAATRTLLATDPSYSGNVGSTLLFNGTTDQTFYVADDTAAVVPVYAILEVYNTGSGNLTITVADASVSLNGSTTFSKVISAYTKATLKKIAANTWLVTVSA